MAVTDGRKSLLTARHRPPFRGVSVSCLFFFILGFFSALFCYTVSMTTSTSFALQSASVHVQLEKNTPSVLKKTAFPDAEVAVGQTTVGVMKNDNDETAAAKGTLHFPSHCLPWPGEDPVVEGGYIGYHLFLLIYKAAQESIQSETKPRFLCLWDLQPEAAPDQMDVADYLMSKCQSVWVLKGVDVEVDALKSTSPALNVWSSTDTEAFWNTLKQEVQDVDWILFVPDGFYVIFELLEAQLRSLSPSRPIAVPAGILSEPNSGKPAARTPEVLCPGWVYSSSAIRQVSDIIPRQTIQESLFESLHKERFTCPKTNSKGEVDVQWTFVNTTSYTQPAHWLRLHSAIHGTCNQYWNSPLGAKNEKGEWGYVHDPTVLRKNPPPFDDYKSNCQAEGEWYDKTRKALAKVEISSEHPRAKKIFCMVYTHSNRHDQLRSIAETWGPKCDGFMAASNLTDPSIGAVNLWHEGPEMYGNMWLKVRSMWEYAHNHYLDKYDFFHIGGDDHFVIPENLRWTVSSGSIKGPWDHTKPLYLGGSLAVGNKRRYCGGGSGYTLNRIALKTLINQLWNEPNCFPHWQGPDEDITLSKCFRILKMQCMDTNDEMEETRYHPWDAAYHANWNHKQLANWYPKLLSKFQGIASKDNMGQISKNSVSFHLKQLRPDPSLPPDSGMRFYYALLYGKCS